MNERKELNRELVEDYVSLHRYKERAIYKASFGESCDEDCCIYFMPEDISDIHARLDEHVACWDKTLEELRIRIGATEEEILQAARA